MDTDPTTKMSLPVPVTVSNSLTTCLLVLALYGLFLGLYNVFIHPLRGYQGPLLFSAYRLPYVTASFLGILPFLVHKWHEKYGSVVRIAPDELAYETAKAWKDIYGFRSGRSQLSKDPYFLTPPYPGMKASIGNAGNALHSKYRRLLAHAFSAQALQAQEPLIRKHVDLLMSRLQEGSALEEPQDLLKWYTWTTFDIVGDLAFGEPFGCLENKESHPWVEMVLDGFVAGIMIAAVRRYVPISLAMRLIPRKLMQSRVAHFEFAKATLARRMERGAGDRPDFVSYIMKHSDDEEDTKGLMMTPEEMQPNAALIVLAGGETTTTSLSGATYYLLKNPSVLARVTQEVRGAFSEAKAITFDAINSKCPYLQAVFEEALRLYPAVATGLPRLTPPQGIEVDGRWVPGNMRVAVFQYTASLSSRNFHAADRFCPERWLSGGETHWQYQDDCKGARQPFGMGPRGCIGQHIAHMEMRLILANILWHFDLTLDERSERWAEQKIYVTWDKGPLMVQLKSRQ